MNKLQRLQFVRGWVSGVERELIMIGLSRDLERLERVDLRGLKSGGKTHLDRARNFLFTKRKCSHK